MGLHTAWTSGSHACWGSLQDAGHKGKGLPGRALPAAHLTPSPCSPRGSEGRGLSKLLAWGWGPALSCSLAWTRPSSEPAGANRGRVGCILGKGTPETTPLLGQPDRDRLTVSCGLGTAGWDKRGRSTAHRAFGLQSPLLPTRPHPPLPAISTSYAFPCQPPWASQVFLCLLDGTSPKFL